MNTNTARRLEEELHKVDVTPQGISYNHPIPQYSRRSIVKGASAAAILAGLGYAASKIPFAYADMQEILVGLSQVPVNFDGQIGSGEYSNDTIDYTYFIFNGIPSKNPEGHLGVKDNVNDGMTYFGIDIPSSTEHQEENLFILIFDTMNQIKEDPGAKGVYELSLSFSDSNPIEQEAKPPIGTSFQKKFSKGQDYDWKYAFAPSPLNPANHTQFEVKVRTDILTEYSTNIGFITGYADAKGVIKIPDPSILSPDDASTAWARLKYISTPVSEFQWKDLTLVGPIAAAAILAKLAASNKPLSRRVFLGVPK
jgi:hypothetical protein